MLQDDDFGLDVVGEVVGVGEYVFKTPCFAFIVESLNGYLEVRVDWSAQ